MSTVPTLYSICFEYLKTHTEDITSLEGIPFDPVVRNLLEYLLTSKIPLNGSILSVVSHSHSKALRKADLDLTKLNFNSLVTSMSSVLKTIKHNFPKFITHLNIGATDLCDNDIYLLGDCTNLKVICFKSNKNITDRTVSYIATMTLNISNGRGLPYLEILDFDKVKGITDKSLKYFGKMKYLSCFSLTNTQVTVEVAKTYLASQGYECAPFKKPFNHWGLSDCPCSFRNEKLQQFIINTSLLNPLTASNNTRLHHLSAHPMVEMEQLTFRRTPLATTKKRASSNYIEEKRPVKQQKMIINDFYNMIEAEFSGDT